MRTQTSALAPETRRSGLRRWIRVGSGAVALVAAALAATLAWRSSGAAPGAQVATARMAPGQAASGSPSPGAPPARAPNSAAVLQGASRDHAESAPADTPAQALDEPALMDRLRRVKEENPATAVALAREGNFRFPDSPDAAERSSILVHALAAQGLSSEARGEAEDMVNRYPDSSWVREVELFTGAHRHRNLRLGENGALEYY